MSGDFCRDCAVVAYEGRTKALLGLAWWGVGIFAAPVFTVINWIALVKCRSLAAPVERAADDADGQIATGNATVNAAGNTTRYAAISPNPFLYAAPVALWLPLAYVLSLLSP